MSHGTVLAIYTGGTIGMVPASEVPGSPLEALQDERRLTENLPQLEALKQEVPFEIVGLEDEMGAHVGAVDSSDVDLRHWTWLAKQIERRYDAYDGFVILHGTDTMAYTASALSYMLTNLAKPVVITGAQIPMSRYDSDGVWNFVRAVQIAGYRHTNQPLVPEVCICFHDRLFRGNRVRKISTVSAQGFSSPNYPVLGSIGGQIKIYPDRIAELPGSEAPAFFADVRFDRRVIDFSLFPGIRPESLEKIVALDAVQGVVLRTFGAGNAPNSPELHTIIGEAVAGGKVVVNVTSCVEGQVEPGLYAASDALLERGVTNGADMTPEAALTKLMWLLGAVSDRAEVRHQMQVDRRGELSEGGCRTLARPKGDASHTPRLRSPGSAGLKGAPPIVGGGYAL